jgi:hypothetical protein
VIQSDGGWLFGGFTSISWQTTGGYKAKVDGLAFIFTLTNPHSIPPTKYHLKNDRIVFSIYCADLYGAVFGNFDMVIRGPPSTSGFNFPSSFNDTTNKGNQTFTGSHTCQLRDIEVYSVI